MSAMEVPTAKAGIEVLIAVSIASAMVAVKMPPAVAILAVVTEGAIKLSITVKWQHWPW